MQDMLAEYPYPDDMMQPEEPVELSPLQQQIGKLAHLGQMDNASDMFTDQQLSTLGAKVVREYKIDKESRSEWEETAERSLKMARQVKEPKNSPWEGASNVKFPILTTAALQFAARAYPAVVSGPMIVKGQVAGSDPDGMKAARAQRVGAHMSYQLINEMDDWESDTDTLLHQLPIVGCAFKKIYANNLSEAGCSSELVPAMDFVVNNRTKHLRTVPRATHCITFYPYEIEEKQRAGTFNDIELGEPGEISETGAQGSDDGEDDQAPHMCLEQHVYWDSDDDGLAEPWIITVHERSQKVLRMVFNGDLDKAKMSAEKIVKLPKKEYFIKYSFIPDPEGGFYDIGFGKLLGALSDVIDTTINQMMDAGTLQNAGGGLIGGNLKLGKSTIQTKPGRFQQVSNAGSSIRDSIYTFEHPGPSAVLFNLLGMMVDSAKEIASVQDILTGDNQKNMTATTTMALIEQGLKVFTAIFKRIYRSMTQEFKLIYSCNQQHMDQEKYFRLLDEEVAVGPQDYADDMDVLPVADPNAVTDMQRLGRAQFLLEQVKEGNPHTNGFEATKRAYEAAGIEKVDEILTPPEGPSPMEELEKEKINIELDNKSAETKKLLAEAEKIIIENKILANQPMTEVADGEPDPPQLQQQMVPEQMPLEMMGEPPMGMPPEEMEMQGLPPEMAQEMPEGMMPEGAPDALSESLR